MFGNLRANKYAKPCITCGQRVEAGEGFLVPRQGSGGGWDVICRTDVEVLVARRGATPPPAAAAPAAPVAPVTPRFRRHTEVHAAHEAQAPVTTRSMEPPAHHVVVRSADGQEYRGIAPGTYTITLPSGSYRTFRVRVQSSDADFAPGRAIIEHLVGASNVTDYSSFGFLGGRYGTVLQPWKRYLGSEALLADARYFLDHLDQAQVAQNCIRCNALLTTPESIAAGIGPTCAGKGW